MTRRSFLPLAALGLSLAGIEFALWAAEAGLLGPEYRNLRMQALAYGAFWPGLLRDWKPNFPLQALTMFATYAFLHAGPVHLAMNMVTLLSLGRAVIERSGIRIFLLVYGASALGGALAYGFISPGFQPMVGASGALFGLAGALIGWEHADRRRLRMDSRPVLTALLLLVGVNLVMYWALDGRLAWQAHLGGAVAGLAGTWLMIQKRERED